MTENIKRTNPVKTFFKDLGWAIKQGARAINRFLERFLPFLTHWPHWLKAALFLVPALTLLGIFTFYPIINSFMVSFYSGYGYDFSEQQWLYDSITLYDNYLYVLLHENFGQAVLNTVYIVVITVPISVFVALLIAVAMAGIKSLKGFYQSIFFLPYVTNSIALGLVFAFMFKGNQNDLEHLGLVNLILSWFGVDPIVWLGAGARYITALAVILIYSIWNGLAFKIIVFLAGIQGIDKQYYQAAQIDGATKTKTFLKITVPMISPMIFYILITSVIGSFKTYSSIVAIVGVSGRIASGIDGNINLQTIVFYIYAFLEYATTPGYLSYAAAASIILFGIILVFTLVQFWVGKKRVHY